MFVNYFNSLFNFYFSWLVSIWKLKKVQYQITTCHKFTALLCLLEPEVQNFIKKRPLLIIIWITTIKLTNCLLSHTFDIIWVENICSCLSYTYNTWLCRWIIFFFCVPLFSGMCDNKLENTYFVIIPSFLLPPSTPWICPL